MNAMTSYLVTVESPDGSVISHDNVSLERVGQLLGVYSFGYVVTVKEIPAYRAAVVADECHKTTAPKYIEMSYAGPSRGNPG